jgi:hypothetical protein
MPLKHHFRKLTTRFVQLIGRPLNYVLTIVGFQNMTLDEAHKLALKILKQVMEENVNENNVQLAQVSSLGHSNIAPRSRELYKSGQSHRKRQGSAVPDSDG